MPQLYQYGSGVSHNYYSPGQYIPGNVTYIPGVTPQGYSYPKEYGQPGGYSSPQVYRTSPNQYSQQQQISPIVPLGLGGFLMWAMGFI